MKKVKVGIYGYTSYPASKFDLRGLAEALQQEVIVDDIHVSLIFPRIQIHLVLRKLHSDKYLFGSKNKRKPRLTSIISASSGAMQPDEVAKIALNGIKSGSFFVPCNFEGYLLSIATSGQSHQYVFGDHLKLCKHPLENKTEKLRPVQIKMP
ncbi:3-dehydrosphinganine reductase TSC10A-like [Rutidosis leptorrhynchoides]|uniref:3-dehydrosphinganine reductase TSC10A-like n=1 Tax=Rutidosis leptorrhynchoides TaxID=125765 RepID=UPI003A98D13B